MIRERGQCQIVGLDWFRITFWQSGPGLDWEKIFNFYNPIRLFFPIQSGSRLSELNTKPIRQCGLVNK